MPISYNGWLITADACSDYFIKMVSMRMRTNIHTYAHAHKPKYNSVRPITFHFGPLQEYKDPYIEYKRMGDEICWIRKMVSRAKKMHFFAHTTYAILSTATTR